MSPALVATFVGLFCLSFGAVAGYGIGYMVGFSSGVVSKEQRH